MKSRIMYIERKAGQLIGEARIGRITFSKTGKTLYYQGKSLQSLKGQGFKSNYFDIETGEDYWISGPKRTGGDHLYGTGVPVPIDDDVREEYWTHIRPIARSTRSAIRLIARTAQAAVALDAESTLRILLLYN